MHAIPNRVPWGEGGLRLSQPPSRPSILDRINGPGTKPNGFEGESRFCHFTRRLHAPSCRLGLRVQLCRPGPGPVPRKEFERHDSVPPGNNAPHPNICVSEWGGFLAVCNMDEVRRWQRCIPDLCSPASARVSLGRSCDKPITEGCTGARQACLRPTCFPLTPGMEVRSRWHLRLHDGNS